MQSTDPRLWRTASEVFKDFARSRPEFGIKPTDGAWIHFQRTHAAKLIEADVIRRIPYRGRMLADTSRFELALFNLLTTGMVVGRAERGQS